MTIDNPSNSAGPVDRLRELLTAVDPAALTVADRLALLDLFERSHTAATERLT